MFSPFANTPKQVSLFTKGNVLDGSLHIFIVTNKTNQLTLAINAGYMFCLNQKTTTINRIVVNDAPDFNMTGLHVGLSLGFGSFKEKGD